MKQQKNEDATHRQKPRVQYSKSRKMERSDLVDINSNDKPYSGDWSMACWNAQGLLATSATKQHRKMARAKKLATHRDLLVMTETHGNEGKNRACRTPLGYKAFWGNSAGGEAGVGLWVRRGFLEAVVGDNGGFELSLIHH